MADIDGKTRAGRAQNLATRKSTNLGLFAPVTLRGETMVEGISRRQFFSLTGQKLRRPIRAAFLFAIAWLAVGVIQAARGITLDGWKLMGCVVLAVVVLAALRSGAARVYFLLPKRGKAMCAAMGEAFSMLTFMAVGALLWHRFQTEHAVGAGAVVVLVCVAESVYKVYDQRMNEL